MQTTMRQLLESGDIKPGDLFVTIDKDGNFPVATYKLINLIMEADGESIKRINAFELVSQASVEMHLAFYASKVVEMRELSQGNELYIVYQNGIDRKKRTLSQKGKIEGYCPYIGQNSMGHSKGGGEEVYLLSTNVIKVGI